MKATKAEEGFLLCYDIDRTIAYYGHYTFCEWGPPIEGVHDHFKKMRTLGYRIMLFTSRSDVEYDAFLKWLKKWDLSRYVERVQFGKPVAEIYIDDRAVHFGGDWSAVEGEVDRICAEIGRNLG